MNDRYAIINSDGSLYDRYVTRVSAVAMCYASLNIFGHLNGLRIVVDPGLAPIDESCADVTDEIRDEAQARLDAEASEDSDDAPRWRRLSSLAHIAQGRPRRSGPRRCRVG